MGVTRTLALSVEQRLNRYRQCGLRPDDCYSWLACTDPKGYGELADGRPGKRKADRAHRLAYEFEIAPIPEGKDVLHTCDNPPCSNPRHLYAGTAAQNTRDKVERGRMVVHVGDDHWTHQKPEKLATGDRHWSRLYPGALRGERNGRARLTTSDVLEIRRVWDGTWEHTKSLAAQYGITGGAMHKIVKRLNWRHI